MFTVLPISRWKCAGRAQVALQPGAADLERVVAGDRIVVIEIAADEAGDERELIEGDAAGAPGGRVDGDLEDAAVELEVVQIELEVGHDGGDQG